MLGADHRPARRREAAHQRLATEAELALRRDLQTALDQLLTDRRRLELPPRLSPEEQPLPPRRVCDEAYLLVRRLVHFGEDELEQLVETDAFLNLPDELKDQEIARARKAGTWRRPLEAG